MSNNVIYLFDAGLYNEFSTFITRKQCNVNRTIFYIGWILVHNRIHFSMAYYKAENTMYNYLEWHALEQIIF